MNLPDSFHIEILGLREPEDRIILGRLLQELIGGSAYLLEEEEKIIGLLRQLVDRISFYQTGESYKNETTKTT